MQKTIPLKPMTPQMHHVFFREYRNDPDLYLNPADFYEYHYDEAKVDAYIQRQAVKKRLCFAIMAEDEIVGEVKLCDITPEASATLSITMKNAAFKDRGYGTQAEKLAVQYAFEVLNVPVVYADCILTNARSRHVLEKVGFSCIGQDEGKVYYKITK